MKQRDNAAKIVGQEPIIEYAGRRAGDPAVLIAGINKAKTVLNWEPKYGIKEIIKHAWEWEQKYQEYDTYKWETGEC